MAMATSALCTRLATPLTRRSRGTSCRLLFALAAAVDAAWPVCGNGKEQETYWSCGEVMVRYSSSRTVGAQEQMVEEWRDAYAGLAAVLVADWFYLLDV